MRQPYYCNLAQEAGGSIALAIFISCSLQLLLSGLLEIMLGLEDPFAGKPGSNWWQASSTRWFDSIDIAEHIEVYAPRLPLSDATPAHTLSRLCHQKASCHSFGVLGLVYWHIRNEIAD
jgi:hypothetical protein